MLIHKAVIFRFVRLRSSGGNGLGHHIIDRLAGIERQAEEYLTPLRRVCYGLWGYLLELFVGRDHYGDRIADRKA